LPERRDRKIVRIAHAVRRASGRPGRGLRANCRVLISASGMITADTPKDFDAFARDRDLRGATIVLDSRAAPCSGRSRSAGGSAHSA